MKGFRCVSIGVFGGAAAFAVELCAVPIFCVRVAAVCTFLGGMGWVDFEDGFAVPRSFVGGKDEDSSKDVSQQGSVEPRFGGGSVGFEPRAVF